MTVRHTFPVVLALVVAASCICVAAATAGEDRPQAADHVFPDPQTFFERLFGPQRDEDRQALAAIEISPQEERQMGERAVRAYLEYLKQQRIRVVTRGRDVEYLRALVETIRPLMTNSKRYPRVNVYLALSSRCEARSFPGGTLVFFRGLVEAAQSEAAVVGIVGHELAHLDRGHHLWRLRRIKLAERSLSRGGEAFSPEQFFAAGGLMLQVWTRPFRPELEAEADRDGARWAYLAGYDPREMGRLFLELGKGRNNSPRLLPEFLRSHPAPEGRHQAIMELYDQLQQEKPKKKLYLGKENLRRRVPRAQREFNE